MRTYAPWNEINHFTQPTFRNPKVAARFTDIARRNCRGCTIVVADILDQRRQRARQEAALPLDAALHQALQAAR